MSEVSPHKSVTEEPSLILPADPRASWLAHGEAIAAAIDRVRESGRYILGPEVEAFEREWAAYAGCGFCVGVANGTDALELALRAAGVGAGDVVLTAANTVTATIAAIDRVGATIALGDIDPANFTLSVPALTDWLQSADAPAVRAIVPVHLYGQPADMPALSALAREHGFLIVEDCAQAHGAQVGNRKAGEWGIAGAFSFYPTKNLGALGDGGAVVTNDPDLAARVRSLRQYGWRERYVAFEPGFNSRLDELQAAVLRVKLAALDEENARRAAIAARYRAELSGVENLTLPQEVAGSETVWHQFVVRHPDRAALQRHLEQQRVIAGVLYPEPVHEQPAYRERVLKPPAGLGEAERACRELLCLPVHPHLGDDDVSRVVGAVRSFGG
ncbi:MAG: DegT/DnrJ/EryC1/StrS family aminotransferase [Opitutaceae bacterium]